MTVWSVAVSVWLASAAIGLALALYGLRVARSDRDAVMASGRNGLLLHLARSATRAWAAKAAIQSGMLLFASLAASIPAPALPADASAGAVARLLILRWALSLVCAGLMCLSIVDIRARRRAVTIAAGRE